MPNHLSMFSHASDLKLELAISIPVYPKGTIISVIASDIVY